MMALAGVTVHKMRCQFPLGTAQSRPRCGRRAAHEIVADRAGNQAARRTDHHPSTYTAALSVGGVRHNLNNGCYLGNLTRLLVMKSSGGHVGLYVRRFLLGMGGVQRRVTHETRDDAVRLGAARSPVGLLEINARPWAAAMHETDSSRFNRNRRTRGMWINDEERQQ
jgi:hypothetical protein